MKKLFYAFALVGLFIFAAPSHSNAEGYENCPTKLIKCYDGSQHYAMCCDRDDQIAFGMLLC